MNHIVLPDPLGPTVLELDAYHIDMLDNMDEATRLKLWHRFISASKKELNFQYSKQTHIFVQALMDQMT